MEDLIKSHENRCPECGYGLHSTEGNSLESVHPAEGGALAEVFSDDDVDASKGNGAEPLTLSEWLRTSVGRRAIAAQPSLIEFKPVPGRPEIVALKGHIPPTGRESSITRMVKMNQQARRKLDARTSSGRKPKIGK